MVNIENNTMLELGHKYLTHVWIRESDTENSKIKDPVTSFRSTVYPNFGYGLGDTGSCTPLIVKTK